MIPKSIKYESIDLLPENVNKLKTLRRFAIKLAAVQVAIFLCIGLMIYGINTLGQRAWEYTSELDRQVYAIRHMIDIDALAYARDIGQRLAAEDAFLQAYAPADFDPVWITSIIQAGSEHMVMLDYSSTGIMITGMSDDMTAIEAHRQDLTQTGVFGYVELGRIIMQDCGRYFYELRVRL
ncbi:MAG: hypothetical protein FWC92_02605 [Defluviitaleaceae bacterium]|nr:hypothetical protein [Defluviitaleaceae bacterium]